MTFAGTLPRRGFGHFKTGHCVDIPFAFDRLDADGVEATLGHTPQELGDAVHGAWVNFIHDGRAGWPAYDLDGRQTMIFDDEPYVSGDPLRFERTAWPAETSELHGWLSAQASTSRVRRQEMPA